MIMTYLLFLFGLLSIRNVFMEAILVLFVVNSMLGPSSNQVTALLTTNSAAGFIINIYQIFHLDSCESFNGRGKESARAISISDCLCSRHSCKFLECINLVTF